MAWQRWNNISTIGAPPASNWPALSRRPFVQPRRCRALARAVRCAAVGHRHAGLALPLSGPSPRPLPGKVSWSALPGRSGAMLGLDTGTGGATLCCGPANRLRRGYRVDPAGRVGDCGNGDLRILSHLAQNGLSGNGDGRKIGSVRTARSGWCPGRCPIIPSECAAPNPLISDSIHLAVLDVQKTKDY
jgi:hypothetical protein